VRERDAGARKEEGRKKGRGRPGPLEEVGIVT
jgi:hypothetical protein